MYGVRGTCRCLFSDKYKTLKYSVDRAYCCWMLNLLVHHVTVGFKRLRYKTSPVLSSITLLINCDFIYGKSNNSDGMHEIMCVWQTWRINSSVVWNLVYLWMRVKIVGVLSSTSRWNIMKACKLQENSEDTEAEIAYFPFLISSCILIFGQYIWPPFSSLSLVSPSWYKRQHEGFVLISVFVLIFLRYIQQLFLLILHFTRCCFTLLSWKRRVFRDVQFLVVFHWCVVGTGCACLYCW
jgi:hypothetical protein